MPNINLGKIQWNLSIYSIQVALVGKVIPTVQEATSLADSSQFGSPGWEGLLGGNVNLLSILAGSHG